MTNQAVQNYLHKNRKNLIKFTKDLCAFKTVNPPGEQYSECMDFLLKSAKNAGLKAYKIRVPLPHQKYHLPQDTWKYPRYNLICFWNVGAGQTIHLNSHYDVVPVSPDWQTNPFKPVERDGKLYGRGTCDMKGCLAASLFAVKALMESGIKPAWNVELSFTADEETGGECGAGYLVHQGIVNPDAVIVCEGGMGNVVTYGHRGVLWMEVIIEGKAGHGSTPSSGVNAFEYGLKIANEIENLKQKFPEIKTRHTISNKEYLNPTMTLGGVSGGGSKVNTIPDRFMFTIDRRLLPEENVKTVRTEIERIVKNGVKGVKGLTAKVNVLNEYDAAVTGINEPICQAVGNAVQSVYNKKPKYELFGAFTDLHFFTNSGVCPGVGYGVEGDGIHSSGEYCNVDSLIKTAQVYAETILSMEC